MAKATACGWEIWVSSTLVKWDSSIAEEWGRIKKIKPAEAQLGTWEIQVQYKENLFDVYKGCQTMEQYICGGYGIPFLGDAQNQKKT